MAGVAAQSELARGRDAAGDSLRRRRGAARFALATRADDAEIRRLLRENPMGGKIAISLEREPDASLAASVEGEVHHTIVARDATSNQLIAIGGVAVRERFVNGVPTRVGYLGQLRLDHRCRPRAPVIRNGYTFLRELHQSLGVKLYLTSIASDNVVARRFLERGLPGMPTYKPVCDFVTVVSRRRRNGEFQKATATARGELRQAGLSLRHGAPELRADVARVLNGAAAQFAPVWSVKSLRSLEAFGQRDTHFRIAYAADGRPVACAAVWDQRSFKQIVVRSYPTSLRLLRVPLNLLSPFTGMPWLPPVGRPFPHAFVSHVATPPDYPELIAPLIELLHGSARTLGVDCLTIGFDARDPRLTVVREHFGGREYPTRLYAVHWEDGAAAADALDPQLLAAPEVALL